MTSNSTFNSFFYFYRQAKDCEHKLWGGENVSDLLLYFILHPVKLYLERSEAEAVEQRQRHEAAEDAVDCREETRSG